MRESLQESEVARGAERQRLEEALRAGEERLNTLRTAYSQLEEKLRTSTEGCAARQKEWEAASRASEEQLNEQIVANGQLTQLVGAQEKRFRALAAATAHVVWMANSAGEIIDTDPSWLAFTGQSAEEAQGGGGLKALHPDDRGRAGAAFQQALDIRPTYSAEYRLRRHDGEYRVLAVHGAPIVDDDGSVREWIGAATDITEAQQAEGGEASEREEVPADCGGRSRRDLDHRSG